MRVPTTTGPHEVLLQLIRRAEICARAAAHGSNTRRVQLWRQHEAACIRTAIAHLCTRPEYADAIAGAEEEVAEDFAEAEESTSR